MASSSSSSSSALLSGAGDNPESFPISKHHHHRFPRTDYTSSSSSSTASSRNSSFGSLSFSSYPENSPIHSFFTLQNSEVPFSWEQHPGIPKKSSNLSRSSKKEHSSSSSSSSSALILLPLPPASCSNLSKRFSFEAFFAIRKKAASIEIIKRDPFVAALMKCTKDDHHGEEAISDLCWKGEDVIINKGSKSSSRSRRFGFNIIDCKNSCSVVESNVLVPKYSQNASYDLLTRRSG